MEHLFVYGTLRPTLSRGIQQELRSHHLMHPLEHVGPASISGFLFDLGSYPGLRRPTPEYDGGVVKGDIYSLAHHGWDTSALLSKIDGYEGYCEENPEGSLYIRSMVRLLSSPASCPVTEAWTYYYNSTPPADSLIKSGDFFHPNRQMGES